MKTMIRTLVLVIGMIFLAGTASAQKIAHVNTDSLVSELSLKDSIQQKLEIKQREYQSIYEALVSEIQKKEAEHAKLLKAVPPVSPPVLSLSEKKIQSLYKNLQEFEQEASQELQAHEVKLMEPIINKIKKSIEEIAKEKGYTYVINDQVLLVSPPADDITNLVRKKLGL